MVKKLEGNTFRVVRTDVQTFCNLCRKFSNIYREISVVAVTKNAENDELAF
ncbi:MAG: hypothetical protein K0S09_1235 [Sphingobacteriaceae bacterium]|jgi:hypothetical protein|nr:hypothetical protein [Sphingobacteriaceae bacterium]